PRVAVVHARRRAGDDIRIAVVRTRRQLAAARVERLELVLRAEQLPDHFAVRAEALLQRWRWTAGLKDADLERHDDCTQRATLHDVGRRHSTQQSSLTPAPRIRLMTRLRCKNPRVGMRQSILLVEDEVVFSLFIRTLLEERGLQVAVAGSAA